jgi:hypothetical protein
MEANVAYARNCQLRNVVIIDLTYIFETVQVLVSLATNFAFVRLLLLHAECSRVRSRSFWIHD